VLDYKTGAPPTKKMVEVGFAPQLTLEAAMAERGAFADIDAGAKVAAGVYVKLMGADGGKDSALDFKERSFSEVASEHFAQLVNYLSSFRNEETGYPSRPYPQYASRYNDYDHLARVKEWSAGENGEDA
jgi:ATP-dependent helicase/nuclease subunit B